MASLDLDLFDEPTDLVYWIDRTVLLDPDLTVAELDELAHLRHTLDDLSVEASNAPLDDPRRVWLREASARLNCSPLGRDDIAACRRLVKMAREVSGQPHGDHWTTLPVVVVTGALSALRLAV